EPVDLAAVRCVRAIVHAVEDAVAVVVHGRPAEARRLRIDVGSGQRERGAAERGECENREQPSDKGSLHPGLQRWGNIRRDACGRPFDARTRADANGYVTRYTELRDPPAIG